MKKIYYMLIGFLLLGGASACQEEEVMAPGSAAPLATSRTLYAIPSYSLDWENIDYMPWPNNDAPRVPWEVTTSYIPFDIRFDYKKEDGWELLYSTFSSNRIENDLYFILYNKYRGVMRLYYLSDPGLQESSYMVSTLRKEGPAAGNSPLLNFSDQEVVDFNVKSPFASRTEEAQFSGRAWYAFEYEVPYDPSIASGNYSNFSMNWRINSVNISKLEINGRGALEGKVPSVSSPGINLSLSSNFTNKSNSGVQITGPTVVENGGSGGGSGSWFTDAIKAGLSKALTNGVSGIATNILSGIFTKKKDNTANIATMKLKATMTYTGTVQSSSGLDNFALPLPGYGDSRYQNTYNKIPGIFYISGRPTVQQKILHYAKKTEWGGGYDLNGSYYTNTYSNPSNFQLIYNPEILKIASIQNVRYEMILLNSGEITSGQIETIGDKMYAVGLIAGYKSDQEPSTEGFVGLRVSFKVVPNDGSPAVLLVKTFKCNINTTTEIIPYQ
ncbi:hypothetical protein MKJ04_05265 [Pontibacter sp. E15-1]|uniref:hypothetical protein n=1 Tax=Pontibacter sp. E15-1 TaxID=2919918 RepID=UPI001F4F73DF|nr:hypothetical protein [Pontibacter sp. E15-1]MCJ8164243.1 hypothetical protein [Pontibacter sp. E15-1]